MLMRLLRYARSDGVICYFFAVFTASGVYQIGDV